MLTPSFLGGEFTSYGRQVIEFMNEEPQNRSDPMYEVSHTPLYEVIQTHCTR